MYGIARIVRHGGRIFQHSAESLVNAHPSFVTLKVFERARFTVWRGALKIRMSLIRFQSRPPNLHRKCTSTCGVSLCGDSKIHASTHAAPVCPTLRQWINAQPTQARPVFTQWATHRWQIHQAVKNSLPHRSLCSPHSTAPVCFKHDSNCPQAASY